MKGWVSIYRKITDSWIWKIDEPFDKRSAWIDILLLVNHEPGKVKINEADINVERGEKIISIAGLAERWKWSRHKVSDFLNRLEMERYVGASKGQ